MKYWIQIQAFSMVMGIILALTVPSCGCDHKYSITYFDCELRSLHVDDDAEVHISYITQKGEVKFIHDLPEYDYTVILSDSNYIQVPLTYYNGGCRKNVAKTQCSVNYNTRSKGHAPIKIYIEENYKIKRIQDSW